MGIGEKRSIKSQKARKIQNNKGRIKSGEKKVVSQNVIQKNKKVKKTPNLKYKQYVKSSVLNKTTEIGTSLKKRAIQKATVFLKRKIVPIIAGGVISIMVFLLGSSIIPIAGITVVMEGYAVVVRIVDDVTDTAKSWFSNIKNAMGDTWDSIRSNFVDTKGADKVDLEDMVSIDDFLYNITDMYYNRVELLKSDYESQGYTVTISVGDGSFGGDYTSAVTGDSGIHGASWETVTELWGIIENEGYNDIAKSAIIGNLIQESTLNPLSKSPSGSYFGLVQWSSGRQKNLQKYCLEHNLNWNSINGQMQFLLKKEMPGYYGKSALKAFKNSTDINEATNSFRGKIEGVGEEQQGSERRTWAQNVYKKMSGKELEVTETESKETEYVYPTETATYTRDGYFYVLKPLWLGIMYGKYESEPTEMEMYDTAVDIADTLVAVTTEEGIDEDGNLSVDIQVTTGGVEDVIDSYYLDPISKLKAKTDADEKDITKLSKYEKDYDFAIELLKYYENDYEDSSNDTSVTIDGSVIEKSSNEKINRMIELALSKVGNKYKYGGNDIDNGIDCSAFTQWCYLQIGISIPRTSSAQSGIGMSVSAKDLQPGDLIFYGNGGIVSHVALYIGNGNIVHASNSKPYPQGGIKISKYNDRTPLKIKRIVTITNK